MILELAILYIKDEQVNQFENDFDKAGIYISSIKGYAGHTLQKCIEQKNKYILLVNWETMDAHTIGFRESSQYREWKKLLHHYYDPFPIVEHYETVIDKRT
jgi:heme-degrading monooxygenase HmoA